jgi:hypothetical protein
MNAPAAPAREADFLAGVFSFSYSRTTKDAEQLYDVVTDKKRRDGP